MNNKYKRTITACFLGYIVQAITNNYAPLLFLTFERSYGVPLTQITLLVTLNFGVQLFIDVVSVSFIDRIGYKASIVIAHIFSATGLISMAILPDIFPSHFAGLLTSVVLYAIGGGLLEVLVSPIVESCPSDNKEATMSMLHSFYCWGHVGVVAISSLFFHFFGIANWKILAILWAIIPLTNIFLFAGAPFAPLLPEDKTGLKITDLVHMKLFWIFFIMMICSGASEQAVSQWASTFAERGLGISKTLGDLAGPMAFAVLMGSSRAFYGKYGDRINLEAFMTYSSLLCIISYLCLALIPHPVIGLISCAVTGLSVGIMWPGTFSKASASIPTGGTALFALLALGGDIGCSSGPSVVGFVSSHFSGNLKTGILVAAIFPTLLLIGIKLDKKKR